MTVFNGVVKSFQHAYSSYSSPSGASTGALKLWPTLAPSNDMLVSAELEDVVLTSWFAVLDPAKGHLFLDQTYTDVGSFFPTRFMVSGKTFRLDSEPIPLPGRHIVIGGPLDTVWYHWLFNWCPRVLVARWLRPDLLQAEDVRLVVHPLALQEPYYAILETFGIPRERMIAVDPNRDYRLEQACLITFLDQRKLYPEVVHAFREHLLEALAIDRDARHPGVFASRQSLPAPKRRIHNFEAIEPVLHARGLRIAALGEQSARDQAQLFHGAEIVLGAHGSDLSNILFCRPKTPVIVIENRFSVANRFHVGLEELARILDLDYRLLVSDTTAEPGTGLDMAQIIARDYVVDPGALAALLEKAS